MIRRRLLLVAEVSGGVVIWMHAVELEVLPELLAGTRRDRTNGYRGAVTASTGGGDVLTHALTVPTVVEPRARSTYQHEGHPWFRRNAVKPLFPIFEDVIGAVAEVPT